jgi:pectate lyase
VTRTPAHPGDGAVKRRLAARSRRWLALPVAAIVAVGAGTAATATARHASGAPHRQRAVSVSTAAPSTTVSPGTTGTNSATGTATTAATSRSAAAVPGPATTAGSAAGATAVTATPSAAWSGPDGYSMVAGTTTGGAGGATVTVTSLAGLTTEAARSGAEIVRVSGSFTCTGDIKVASNKTIAGVGPASGLTGCGLSLKSVSNVIVRNLRIAKVTASSGSGDAIHLEKSNHVWIDHNDLSSDQQHGKDYYDGLIDITHASDYVTVSWNYLHDHYKASLVGHSDSNAAQDTGHLHVTYHHNYFKNINSRMPSLRFGTGHVYDNYFVNGDTGVHSRMGAQMLVQNNVFRSVATPILTTGDSKTDGYVNESGNDLGTGKNDITRTGTFTKAPYPVTLDPTASVIALVTTGAGTGHIA